MKTKKQKRMEQKKQSKKNRNCQTYWEKRFNQKAWEAKRKAEWENFILEGAK